MMIKRTFAFFLVLASGFTMAQDDLLKRYESAEKFLPINARKLVYRDWVAPNYYNEGKSFWYSISTRNGKEFFTVDVATGKKKAAFDQGKLAKALNKLTGESYKEYELPFRSISYGEDLKSISFDLKGKKYICPLKNYKVRTEEVPAQKGGIWNEGAEWGLIQEDYNLLRVGKKGDTLRLTNDGTDDYCYGGSYDWYNFVDMSDQEDPIKVYFSAVWAGKSNKVIVPRIDYRHSKMLYLLQSKPKEGYRVKAWGYHRGLPGDTTVGKYEYYLMDVVKGTSEVLDLPRTEDFLHQSPMTWNEKYQKIYYRTFERGYHKLTIYEIDPFTGKTRELINEVNNESFVDWAYMDYRIVESRDEILLMSEADGWNQLYTYDIKTGKKKRQLTKGEFVVRNIVRVDEESGDVYFMAGGKEAGRNPYYKHMYKVSLDGGDIALLTPENADHNVTFSTDGKSFVDNYSRVDFPTRSVLKKSSGEEILMVEKADDKDLLATGWRYPERFTLKARDGKTDIYGAIIYPSNFDPSKKYPIIENTYTGPHTINEPISFSRAYRNYDQCIAELGFIMIMTDGLGSAYRSKEFHDFSYRNLGDMAMDEKVAAINAMADKHSFIDREKVGIYGHSAGGYDAARALLKRPDFYKVAVSSAGNHDHRIAKAWWPECYMGYPVEDQYEEQSNLTLAHKLEGKLLLVHGDMDNNVNPACTFRFADKLMSENKDFDMLILPNEDHNTYDHPYFIKKRWDYFVEHLRGEVPPKNFKMEKVF